MTSTDSGALVLRFIDEVWNRGSLAAAAEMVDPEYEVAGVGRGPEAVLRNVRAFRAAFPDLHVTVEELLVDGDRVAARLSLQGTHLGPFRGHPPTGRRATWQEAAFWRVRAGRLAAGWFVADALGLRRQLGIIVGDDECLTGQTGNH